MELTLSKKQVETLKDFFSWEYRDILYGWGARWGKSWLIWVLLAICIASMPGSTWLIARTVLSDLKGTTLSTFFQVLAKLGFTANPKWKFPRKDKIRDEKKIIFDNWCEVVVMQVNNEPSDPEFDRLGSYSLTWAFLDEGQQMVTKVRSVLKGRFSETSGDFKFEMPKPKKWERVDTKNMGYSIRIKVVWQAALDKNDLNCEDIKEIIREGKHFCAIVDYYDLFIPYTIVDQEEKGEKLILTAVWEFKAVTLISCNPWKNFTYTDFYKPYAKWLLEWDESKYMVNSSGKITKKFIKALVTDNPFVDEAYVSWLEDADEVTKQRLLYGNFEYDDDPTLLFDIDSLDNMFKWKAERGMKFLTIDAARMGKDATAIWVWDWLTLKEIITIDRETQWPGAMKLTSQAKFIQKIIDKERVLIWNVIVDEVGVGWGLVDLLWCKGFIANASPMHPYSAKLLSYKKRNYANLRTQAFFYLQKYIREWSIKVNCSPTMKEVILEELGFVRQAGVDDDKKIALESKKEMKAILWRSPDIWDMMSFRMWWIIKNHHDGNLDQADKEQSDIQEDTMANFVQGLIDELDKEGLVVNWELDLWIYD